MPDATTLALDPRRVLGKQVKQLRHQGIVPANIFGRGFPSLAVQAPLAEFRRAVHGMDRNTVMQAQVAGEPDTRPVVIRNIHTHPVTRQVLHVDLYQVDLAQRIHSSVSVVLTGVSEAVANGGVLVHSLTEVQIEALPMEMPPEFTVDVSVLTEFGHSVSVGDLTIPASVTLLTDPTTAVVSVVAPRLLTEEEEEADAAALAEGEEAEEAVEGAEGAPAAAGADATADEQESTAN